MQLFFFNARTSPFRKLNALDANPPSTDMVLAAACCAGERYAQRMLWERYSRRMFGVCLRFANSPTEAEDLLQEGFVQVFQNICKYRGEGNLEGWIRRIVVRTALEQLQKQRQLPETLNLDVLEGFEFESMDESDTELPERLLRLLQQMPPGFRSVLNLYVLEDHSHEEIARELGITVSTSKSQLIRAKTYLRKLLNKTLMLI